MEMGGGECAIGHGMGRWRVVACALFIGNRLADLAWGSWGPLLDALGWHQAHSAA